MRNLEKIIKDALDAKKCKFGAREVMHSTKGSRLIVLTKSVSEAMKSKICNRPFRVSAIALKIGDDDEIRNILEGN